MRLATRRLHALDNVAPLTFPVCGVCDKAIMAQPYEVDGKSYHQGGCLIELGHRVTEEVWRAKEVARVAAEERSKLYEKSAYRPPVTYQPFTTISDGTSLPFGTSGPYFGGAGGNIGGVNLDSNTTIYLPSTVVTTGGVLLSSMATSGTVSGSAARTDHTHSSSVAQSHTHTAIPATTWAATASWDTVALADGDAIEFSATVTNL